MPNINNVAPTDLSTTPSESDNDQSQVASNPAISGNINDLAASDIKTPEEHYGTPFQQLGAGLEGAGQGILGPIAPLIERGFGVTGEDIQGRQAANPVTHALGEAAGFIGSAAAGSGIAPLVESIGKGAAALTGIGEGASTIAKIAATGIKASAEMSALAGSTELSKMVEGDPGQTLGSAALNIGLSGILGGAGGATLGGISQLWGNAKNLIGVEKLASDYMGETKALQEAGDPVVSATNELKERMDAADNMWKTMSETKPQVLAASMPENTVENAEKIDAQIQTVADSMMGALKKADQSIKTKAAVPYLYEDFSNFQDAVTHPDATFADKFAALNKLKTTLQSYAKWAGTEEATAKGALGAALSSIIKPALEDTAVWGAAGKVQKVTNEAISEMIAATKDMRGAVTSKILGESEVAPEKVQTLINQTNAGKLGRKATVVGNYLDATEKYADAIRQVHIENNLGDPLGATLNPTPVLNHALNTEVTPGVALARWINQKGSAALGNAAGKVGAGVVGGGLGALVGHPVLGAWMGEKVLNPIFSAIARPLATTAIDSAAAKATVEYLGNAYKGQQMLGNSISSLFGKGAEVLGKDLIPNQESRNKLQKSLDFASNPQNAFNIGGSLGHYLPDHATAAAETGAQAVNYLNSLKPTQPISGPLDATPPLDKIAQAKYNRALDVAQQPLLPLQHIKDGTLLPQDVEAMRTIYPGLHDAMIKKMTDGLIAHKAAGNSLPYSQRVAMNLFMGGNPLDSTMSPQSAQAIIQSASPQSLEHSAQVTQGKPKRSGATQAALGQIQKVNNLYATPLQARQIQKRA